MCEVFPSERRSTPPSLRMTGPGQRSHEEQSGRDPRQEARGSGEGSQLLLDRM
jgi:hypothetical protein